MTWKTPWLLLTLAGSALIAAYAVGGNEGYDYGHIAGTAEEHIRCGGFRLEHR